MMTSVTPSVLGRNDGPKSLRLVTSRIGVVR